MLIVIFSDAPAKSQVLREACGINIAQGTDAKQPIYISLHLLWAALVLHIRL